MILSSCLLFIFFFYFSSAHRALHSFPTRRSSDLACRNAQRAGHRKLIQPEHERDGDGSRDHHANYRDRKSTRLNSSHVAISYAVFCLKKKKKKAIRTEQKRRNKKTKERKNEKQ